MKSASVAIVLLLAGALSQTLPGQTVPFISGGFNGGSFDRRLAPGLFADAFGNNLGTDTSVAVTVGGKQAKATLAIPTQLVIEIPVDIPVGPASILVGNPPPFNTTCADGHAGPGQPSGSDGGAISQTPLLHLIASDGKTVYLTDSQPSVGIGGVPAQVCFSSLAPGFGSLSGERSGTCRGANR